MALTGPPDLTELLGALRDDGIPVGPAELTRLHHAFKTAPRLEREPLRRFLACLLAKSPDHRRRFDQRFDTWCPDLTAEWGQEPIAPPKRDMHASTEKRAKEPEIEPFERPKPVERRVPWLPAAGLIAALILAGTLIFLLLQPPPGIDESQDTGGTGPAVPMPKVPEAKGALPANPVPRAWFWRAKILGVEIPFRLAAQDLALIALLSGLLAAGLWWRYRRHSPRPPRLPPTAGGPPWLPLPAVRGSDTTLMDPGERRGLVWNIGRFAAEDLTRRLDEPATVAATARGGGLAEIRYKHARFPREVWLWLDEHSDDSTLDALAGEIADSLGRAGLQVRRGSFAGAPTRVWWRHDDYFEPTRVEGHRQHAMVALLTDGLGLARDLRSPLRARHVVRLLRQLKLWPHLTLVDFGPPGQLARRMRPYGLGVIQPRDLAGWLGGLEGVARADPSAGLQGDRRLWAAACCLGNDPPDAASAQRLRQRLGLKLDTWVIRDLQRDAGGSELRWPEPRRRFLINWLLRVGSLDDGGVVAADSPATLAIAWWQERYRSESRARGRRQSRLLPWGSTSAQRNWALEDSLLVLYRNPRQAVPSLQAMWEADPRLKDDIRERLGGLRASFRHRGRTRPCRRPSISLGGSGTCRRRSRTPWPGWDSGAGKSQKATRDCGPRRGSPSPWDCSPDSPRRRPPAPPTAGCIRPVSN